MEVDFLRQARFALSSRLIVRGNMINYLETANNEVNKTKVVFVFVPVLSQDDSVLRHTCKTSSFKYFTHFKL